MMTRAKRGFIAIWLLVLILLAAGVVSGSWYISTRQALPQQPASTTPSKSAQPSTVSSTLARILTERSFWGKDFAKVLAYFDSWNSVGERSVTIFLIPNEIDGNTTYESRADAQAAAEKLAAAMQQPQPEPRANFSDLIGRDAYGQPPPFRVEVIPFLSRDSFRVAWIASALQFLPQSNRSPVLTLKHVEELLGPPEKVTSEEFASGTMRPSLLTLHHYAGGSVVFVESDLVKGSVTRVILDVATVRAGVFQERR